MDAGTAANYRGGHDNLGDNGGVRGKEGSAAVKVAETGDDILNRIVEICHSYGNDKSFLIQILLKCQEEYNWLSKDVLRWIGEILHVPLNEIYEITTFYKVFNLIPKGKNLLKVCNGTACHVRKAPVLLSKVSSVLGIDPGETTKDMLFGLETVGCLGCCALGPVLVVNDQYYSNPTIGELKKIIAAHK
ncbi:MAG TPA: NAD(P)H-dependent oxidoreductase subunit E [Firmicutes bacterium]|jgi:NADH-quinone oxidoreductase subunit E|nr:NAD(P)H-dependent oxidoreductase subunit E [Bacillota bacterium]